MSTEMKRETVGWQHVAAAPSHTHTEQEGERKRDGHAHLHPFAVSQVISGNSCSCTAIGTGFGKGTMRVWLGIGAGIWLKFSLLAWQRRTFTNKSNLHQNFIYLVLPLLCVDALVCVCVCRCCCKASRVANAGKSEIVFVFASCKIRNNKRNSRWECSTLEWPANRTDLHACASLFYKIFPYSLLISKSDIWYWNRVAALCKIIPQAKQC